MTAIQKVMWPSLQLAACSRRTNYTINLFNNVHSRLFPKNAFRVVQSRAGANLPYKRVSPSPSAPLCIPGGVTRSPSPRVSPTPFSTRPAQCRDHRSPAPRSPTWRAFACVQWLSVQVSVAKGCWAVLGVLPMGRKVSGEMRKEGVVAQ